MAKLKVVSSARLEVNGKIYNQGDLIDETEFKPRPENAPEEELSELDSLLESGHIVIAEEV